MKATYVQRGEYLDYVPEGNVGAGDIILFGTLAAVSKLDIEAGKLGAVATTGVFDIVKDANAVARGAKVYWDGTKATASADNGQTGEAKVGYTALGIAIQAASAADGTVRILLNA